MKKPAALKRGDKIAIVSLSDGVLGEPFAKHEVVLLEKRLREEFGLNFAYMDNAKKGIEYLKKHPEARAKDLIQAFTDKNIKAIWTVLGGDDTFRILPFLMNDEFKKIVQENPKVFLGFSDTTNNHLMLYKLGLLTYYAPSLLADVAELGPEIFPYTKEWLMELFEPNTKKQIASSPVWYGERKSFGEDQLGVRRPEYPEKHGFEFVRGKGVVEGKLLGGCLDSLYEMLKYVRYDDQKEIFEKYPIFPEKEIWRDKVLFIETSEEKPTPEKYEKMLEALEARGVFEAISAMIVGKPQGEVYYEEYKNILLRFAEKYNLPFVYNLNFGHNAPRMVLPYGQKILINFDEQKITLVEEMVENG
ncbi:MAG: LD-carboxypeptidase [Candidatus Saccharibacteria bacterium]|nr:LD-carboxypeptidase [Candidatus Saccharibacteria bacterium]